MGGSVLCALVGLGMFGRYSLPPASVLGGKRVRGRGQARSPEGRDQLYSKVRALTRVAGRVSEQVLLEQGLVHTASQLERLVRDSAEPTGSVPISNGCGGRDGSSTTKACWFSPQGCPRMKARSWSRLWNMHSIKRLPRRPHQLTQQKPPIPRIHPTQEETDRGSAADALVVVAMAALSAGPADSSGDDRHLVVVHVDAGILTAAEPAPRCPHPPCPPPLKTKYERVVPDRERSWS